MDSDSKKVLRLVLQNSDFGIVRRRGELDEGSQTFLEALLINGIQSYRLYANAASKEDKIYHKESVNWITSDREDYPFSFVCVCDALGICPDYLRRGVLADDYSHRIRRDS